MPTWALHVSTDKWFRVAVIAEPEGDGATMIEWLEGPLHERRQLIDSKLVKHGPAGS